MMPEHDETPYTQMNDDDDDSKSEKKTGRKSPVSVAQRQEDPAIDSSDSLYTPLLGGDAKHPSTIKTTKDFKSALEAPKGTEKLQYTPPKHTP